MLLWESIERTSPMEGERKFIVWLVSGLLILALVSMGGCD